MLWDLAKTRWSLNTNIVPQEGEEKEKKKPDLI